MILLSLDEIMIKLESIFQDVFDMPGLVVKAELSASDIEEWDSLNHVRIISATEDLFGIRFTAEEIDNLNCVGEFTLLIMKKLSSQPAA